jgi:hypothetical protein
MPKTKDEILLEPMSFEGASLSVVYKALVSEHERLVASARAIAFYAIRSSMDGTTGSISQSERTYLLMWLADRVSLLASELPPRTVPSLWTVDEVAAEYRSLEDKAKKHWADHGGVLRFDCNARGTGM